MKVTCASLTMLLATVSSALVQGYSVEPVKSIWSGHTDTVPPYNYVSQTVTCCFDSVVYCELFVGSYNDTSAFKVDVYETDDGPRVAYNDGVPPGGPHRWLRLDLTTIGGQSFTKGKQYEFRFTRSGSDSIQYYCVNGDAGAVEELLTTSGMLVQSK